MAPTCRCRRKCLARPAPDDANECVGPIEEDVRADDVVSGGEALAPIAVGQERDARGARIRPSSDRKLRPIETGICHCAGRFAVMRASDARSGASSPSSSPSRTETRPTHRPSSIRHPVNEVGNRRAGDATSPAMPARASPGRGSVDDTKMRPSVSATGSACHTLSTVLAITVLTPMATASVRTITHVGAGFRHSVRRGSRKVRHGASASHESLLSDVDLDAVRDHWSLPQTDDPRNLSIRRPKRYANTLPTVCSGPTVPHRCTRCRQVLNYFSILT